MAQRCYRYIDIITASFVAVLLISNVTATKVFVIKGLVFDGGAFIFPISYIFGDILTEVYGYARSRRVIWLGFLWLGLFNLILTVVRYMPPEPSWNQGGFGQAAFDKILGLTPRLALAGMLGYFWGEFSNSYILAKMKLMTRGKHLWMRTIGSTIVGELVDTAIFCLIAFWGELSIGALINLIIVGYLYKTGVEVIMTPVTYAIVYGLKRAENEDYYDWDTNFNPFKFELGA